MRFLFKLFQDSSHNTTETRSAPTRHLLIKKLFGILRRDIIEELPKTLSHFADIDLNIITDYRGNGMLSVCSWAWTGQSHCLAYLLDKGLDPFVLDQSAWGPAAIHISVMHSRRASLRRLMGFAFADPRFTGFKARDGIAIEENILKLLAEDQTALREIQTIFYTYRGYHASAETAANLTPPDHLLAALHYFLAASQMKKEVADKEEDLYLKRFHLKKVVNDLEKSITHYHQTIIKNEETSTALDGLDQCLTLSAEIVDSVEPDNPEMDWEIKLGNREFFDHWRIQLEALQEWQETRRTSFSSTSSGTSAGGVEVDIKPAEETDDESAALLGAGGGLRYRK